MKIDVFRESTENPLYRKRPSLKCKIEKKWIPGAPLYRITHCDNVCIPNFRTASAIDSTVVLLHTHTRTNIAFYIILYI